MTDAPLADVAPVDAMNETPVETPVEAAMIASAEEARLRDPRLSDGMSRLAPLLTDAVSAYCDAATPVVQDSMRFGTRTGLAGALDPDPAAPAGRWATMPAPNRSDRAHVWMDGAAIRTLLSKSLRAPDGASDALPASKVEQRMTARIADVVGRCVKRAFGDDGPAGGAELVPLAERPDPRDLAGPGTCILFDVGAQQGRLAVILPVDGPAVARADPARPVGALTPPLADARLRVAATVPCRVVTLGTAMTWEPGAFVEFGSDPSGPVRVTIGGTPLFEGEVGQHGGPDLACRITAPFPPEEAFP